MFPATPTKEQPAEQCSSNDEQQNSVTDYAAVGCQNPTITTMECLAPPATLLGRTLSASAVDYREVWRNKKMSISMEKSPSSTVQSPPLFHASLNASTSPLLPRIAGTKRKYSSQDGYSSASEACRLPNFVTILPSATTMNSPPMLRPMPNNNAALSTGHPEFMTPTQPKKLSRPNSPSNAGARPVLPRGRVASIRRESDCSTENEAAHEKMVKSAQQVSVGFEDFCLDDKLFEERKRAKSLTEPISIFTNAFLPQSSSPSPTRANVDSQKQCYSPSTQQVVRSNIPYSPSPSPTPGSPYNRMRSMSPITVRHISKRRYTGTGCGGGNGNGSGMESDGESSGASSLAGPGPPKRQCTTASSASSANASPLVRDSTPLHLHQHFTATSLAEPATPATPSTGRQFTNIFSSSVASPICSNASNSSGGSLAAVASPAASATRPHPQLLVDPQITAQCFEEEERFAEEDGPLMSSFCSGAYDANSSTTFSSRANTPHSEMLDNSGTENDIPALLLPPQSSCSSDGSQSSMRIVGTPKRQNSQQFEQQQPPVKLEGNPEV